MRKETQSGLTVFTDMFETVRLTVDGKEGHLQIIGDGPEMTNKDGLICYKNNEITYDRKMSLE